MKALTRPRHSRAVGLMRYYFYRGSLRVSAPSVVQHLRLARPPVPVLRVAKYSLPKGRLPDSPSDDRRRADAPARHYARADWATADCDVIDWPIGPVGVERDSPCAHDHRTAGRAEVRAREGEDERRAMGRASPARRNARRRARSRGR
jgi:hypothetical protein